jgi:4-amino-4-deoxy-L-arabinose transferase-like glycosyltransferase
MRVFPASITVALAVAVFVFGVRYGTFVAADTDPYGYVSEAEFIARGTLRIDQRFALDMPWREAEASFIPVAYKEGTRPGFIVPTYPPGLPLVMALTLRFTNAREAVFYVVPLFGALLIVATAWLGRSAAGWNVGAAAALLVATSPSVLLQVTQPVSDVPAAAWWTVALLFALDERKWAAGVGGAAAALATLTRPNLFPLGGVLVVFLMWRWRRAEGSRRSQALRNVIVFLTIFASGCLTVAAFNQYLYGSPLRSGYAPFSELYQWHHVALNLDRYPRWLLTTQSPFIYLGLAAPWLLGHRAPAMLLLAFAAVVFCCYLPYGYFGRDDWGYLRFILPAYPALLVSSAIAGRAVLQRAIDRPRFVAIAGAAFVAALAAWQVRESVQRGVLLTHQIDQRYKAVGRYVASGTPTDAVVIAGLHSGSIRYYSDRLTIYYQRLHFRALDHAVAALTARGRKVYVMLEHGEEADFRWHFATDNDYGKLDWPAQVQTNRGTVDVRIYDTADRTPFLAGQPVLTYDMDRLTDKPVVTQR